nr:bifunctional riboflavin kinase/FAD synthetase [Maliibacterium massiliense]
MRRRRNEVDTTSLTSEARDVVVALGMFDGVHLGHRHLLSMALEDARQMGVPLHVYTFIEHPQQVLRGVRVPLLMPMRQKIGMLSRLGVDCLHLVHFNQVLADMSYEAFLDNMIRDIGMTHLVMGYDACIGKEGMGTAQRIHQEAGRFGITVRVVPPVVVAGGIVSSTRIRTALQHGDLDFANRCLGRSYTLYGSVVEGRRVGRSLGFPTANLALEEQQLLPPDGVFVSRVVRADGTAYAGMTNIGTNPTFQRRRTTVETYLLDFDEEIYGEALEVQLLHRIRDEAKFRTAEQLSAQLQQDVVRVREYFSA